MANGVRFIRVNGRVVPIRDKGGGAAGRSAKGGQGTGGHMTTHKPKTFAFSGAHHGTFAAAGAASQFLMRGRSAGSQLAGATLQAGSGLANLVNSIQHGRTKAYARGGNVWSGIAHGLGRNITNGLAYGVGGIVGAGSGLRR